MNIRKSFLIAPLAGGMLLGLTLTAPVGVTAAPDTPAVVEPLTIPAPPVMPTTIPFSDEIEGRHLVYDTHLAYQNAGSLSFEVHWETVEGGPGEAVPVDRFGMESIGSESKLGRIALMVERDSGNGERVIRRAVSDGKSLLSTLFDQPRKSTDSPTRSFTRLPLDDSTPLHRALEEVQIETHTRAMEFAVYPDRVVTPPEAILWRAGDELLPGVGRAVVVDQVPVSNTDENKNGRQRVCRYLIDPESHRLLRFEEWDIDRNHARPARKVQRKDANGVKIGPPIDVSASTETINYRRETYEKVSIDDTAVLPVALWSVAAPAGYHEEALPNVKLDPLPAQQAAGAFDPKALALILRWKAAQMRYLTLSTDIDYAQIGAPRTADARTPRDGPGGTKLHYQVLVRRPAFAHITIHTITGNVRWGVPHDGVAVSDGQQVVSVIDGVRRTRPFRDPGPLYSFILQAGLRDPFNAINPLFNPPNAADYDRITYDGQALLDNREPVQVFTLHNSQSYRNGTRTFDVTTRYYLGPNDLPHEIESRTEVKLSGGLARDQPPIVTRTARYRNMTVDNEPSSTAFTLP